MSDRVILAYSGGLDTSVAISWIGKETGREVVAVAIDLGQGGEDMEVVRKRALDCGAVEAVDVGADRIAANGDVANKIGTYSLAVLAKENGVPFYVAAPTTTVDLACPDGGAIPIEERPGAEMLTIGGQSIAPAGVPARYVAFDVTPARLVSGLITERGVLAASREALQRAFPERAGRAAEAAE